MGWIISYRPASSADADFLLHLYGSTRSAELAQTGWDATACKAFVRMQFKAQATHYETHWPTAMHSIVQASDGDSQHNIGRLWLHQRPDSLHVLDIALLPGWRGQGIGRDCLQGLQARAAGQHLALSIQVEQGNPARRLYESLGFVPIGEQQGIHQFMRWKRDIGAAAPFQTEALSEQT